MSKKKLKKGLESLFGDWGEPIEDIGVIELENTEGTNSLSFRTDREKPHSKKDDNKKSNAGKNFTTDLDSLFQETMRESVVAQLSKKKDTSKKPKNKKADAPKAKKRRVIPRSGGLDSLIRSTVEDSIMVIEPTSNNKRVSFVFDKSKLKKLKSIAKIKKAHLKDIIDEVVAEYLAEFENKHGNIE